MEEIVGARVCSFSFEGRKDPLILSETPQFQHKHGLQFCLTTPGGTHSITGEGKAEPLSSYDMSLP